MHVHAIITKLDTVYTQVVISLWNELEEACGLRAIFQTPIPHFSWQVAGDYDLPGIEKELRQLANELKPMMVRTTGLAVFEVERPILYIALEKDSRLARLQQRVTAICAPYVKEVNPHYLPGIWVPHITLANRDLTNENLPCALELMEARDLQWEMRVDNFAVVQQEEGKTGEVCAYFEFGSMG